MLTHIERQALITRPFQIMTVYTGKIWGGVQVIDKFMRESQEDILDNLVDTSDYCGLYAGAGELAEEELRELLQEEEL